MANNNKKYVKGQAREFKFSNGDSIINLSFYVKELIALAGEKGWVNLTVAPRRETDQYGNTHSVYLNEWKPSEKSSGNKSSRQNDDRGNDLPF